MDDGDPEVAAEMETETMTQLPEAACPSARPRRFDSFEVGALISNLVLASTALCPDDGARLETHVGAEVITLRCPSCGSCAEWRAPAS